MHATGKFTVAEEKPDSDWADVTSSGRSFQVCGPATGKARLPTVERRNDRTIKTIKRSSIQLTSMRDFIKSMGVTQMIKTS